VRFQAARCAWVPPPKTPCERLEYHTPIELNDAIASAEAEEGSTPKQRQQQPDGDARSRRRADDGAPPCLELASRLNAADLYNDPVLLGWPSWLPRSSGVAQLLSHLVCGTALLYTTPGTRAPNGGGAGVEGDGGGDGGGGAAGAAGPATTLDGSLDDGTPFGKLIRERALLPKMATGLVGGSPAQGAAALLSQCVGELVQTSEKAERVGGSRVRQRRSRAAANALLPA
jgi:hypothetical protein